MLQVTSEEVASGTLFEGPFEASVKALYVDTTKTVDKDGNPASPGITSEEITLQCDPSSGECRNTGVPEPGKITLLRKWTSGYRLRHPPAIVPASLASRPLAAALFSTPALPAKASAGVFCLQPSLCKRPASRCRIESSQHQERPEHAQRQRTRHAR